MKNLFLLMALPALLAQGSCGKVAASAFGPKTPREQYEKKLDETPAAKRWRAVSELALASPVKVSLPYQHKGNFPDTLQLALGLEFKARKGEQVRFDLAKDVAQDFALYADLFYQEPGGQTVLLYSADTTANAFNYDIETEGTYVLRLQPGLLDGGKYTLSITGGPSIGFPVSDPKANIGSFWGADRDGGKRRHEGIDIFAKKGSPAIAAMDGYITAVQETPIGGKVVWLRPEGKDYTLYYAHLDHQNVYTGQTVRKGDLLGTVGNTGNARTTPAHLHFGIYTFQGPVNPLPFVNNKIKQPAAVPTRSLAGKLKPAKATREETALLTPIGVNAKGYLAADSTGLVTQAPFTSVKLISPTENNRLASVRDGKNNSHL